MKIIYYSPHPNINMAAPSGPGTHIREVVGALRDKGCEVITLIGGGETMEHASPSIAFAKRTWKKWIPTWIWQTLKDFRLLRFDRQMGNKLRYSIAQHKPDAVYERAAYLMSSGSKVCNDLNIRHLLEINAPYPEEKKQMEGWSPMIPLAKVIEKRLVTKAHAVFTVSSAMKAYLERDLGHQPAHVHVVPNAVGAHWLNPAVIDLTPLRAKYQIEITDLVIGFVGSIFPYHGVDRMIQAATQLEHHGQRAYKMVVVGDGEILPELKKLAESSGVAERFIFTGNVPHSEVMAYIQLMDICVMPRSNWYGSPVKIFEYGAMGKCIIGPNVIPVQDVMVSGVDGILIEDKADALSEALLHLVKSYEERAVMAKEFQQKVHQHYTWAQVARKIADTLR